MKKHSFILHETRSPSVYPHHFFTEEELTFVPLQRLETLQLNRKLNQDLADHIRDTGFKGTSLSCISFDSVADISQTLS